MFCVACGTEISFSTEVCPHCGRAVAEERGVGSRASRRSSTVEAAPLASWESGAWATVTTGRPPRSVTVGDTDDTNDTDLARDQGGHLSAAPTAARSHSAVAEAPARPAGWPTAGAPHAPGGSIYAGDLEPPGFPRDTPRRVALLVALGMTADILLPWVLVNGQPYAPATLGLAALAPVAALALVVAPMLAPRLRRSPGAQTLPFGMGMLLLGAGLTLWLIVGPLANRLATALIVHMLTQSVPVIGAIMSSPTASLISVQPAAGLYVFLLGACALVGAGYRILTRPPDSYEGGAPLVAGT